MTVLRKEAAAQPDPPSVMATRTQPDPPGGQLGESTGVDLDVDRTRPAGDRRRAQRGGRA